MSLATILLIVGLLVLVAAFTGWRWLLLVPIVGWPLLFLWIHQSIGGLEGPWQLMLFLDTLVTVALVAGAFFLHGRLFRRRATGATGSPQRS